MSIRYTKGIAEKALDGDIVVVVSDETIDRSGESLPIKGWDLTNFNTAPRMFVDHDYRVEALTGMWKNARVEDGKLKMTPVFHGLTEVARVNEELVKQGFLNTVSVGYLQRKRADGSLHLELLEVSWVGVPCNPSARVERLAVKDIGAEDAKAVEAFAEAFERELKAQEAAAAQDAPEPSPVAPEPETPPADAPAPAQGPEEPAAPAEEPAPAEAPTAAEPAKPEPEGEKGLIDDTLEEAQELAMKKFAVLDPMFTAWWRFLDATMVATVPVEAIPTMVAELCEQLISIAGGTAAAPAPEDALPAEMMGLGIMLERKGFAMGRIGETEEKAGRVLSGKNRGIIQASLDAMSGATSAIGEATAALTDLLGASEPSQGGASGSDDNEPADEKAFSSKFRKDLEEIAARKRLIRLIATQLSEGLSKLKTPRT